ncbi:hypothetical protein V8C40DRAFT_116626 [Trichoderma camerunense]
MALHMARIHLDAHICTTPSDLYQKGVARVTQLQAMDVFGIAYSRALCGNMESRIPVSFFVCVVGETGSAEWPGRLTPAGVHPSMSWQGLRDPRRSPTAIASQLSSIFPLPFSLILCQLPSPFSPFWATMATLLLQVVLPSNDDLHRDYSIAAVVRRCNQCDALGSLFSLNIELPAGDVRVLVAPMFEWPAHSTGLQSAAWTSHWFYEYVYVLGSPA